MSLSYANVKSLKPSRGLREAIIDITLDGSYVNGGWEILPASITSYSAISNVIYNLVPPANRGGYSFEWDQVAGKLKAYQGAASQGFEEAAWAEYTAYPAGTFTEQAASLARVVDGGVASLPLSTCSSGAGYTSNYQFFPDTPVALVDYVLFGGLVPFGQIAFDMSATVATYDATGVVGWNYWNGTAWADLDASIIYDGSGSTGTTGDYAWEQDGTMTIVPPQDWAALAVDGVTAYWIKASIETGKTANMTQEPIATTEHDLNVLTTGYVPIYDGVVNAVTLHDGAATIHSGTDIEFYLMNFTTGRSSGVMTFIQDVRAETIQVLNPVPVSIGDKLGVVITVEDGTNEVGVLNMVLHYSGAEALASDKNLNGLVVRCHAVGT